MPSEETGDRQCLKHLDRNSAGRPAVHERDIARGRCRSAEVDVAANQPARLTRHFSKIIPGAPPHKAAEQ